MSMRYLRPKGYLGAAGHTVALLLITVALVMVAARLAALPGAGLAGGLWLDPLVRLGHVLDAGFTLAWVTQADRQPVEYLLMLPTAALLIVIARLTFGLRVLGFRSILIAVGFQELGVLPSAIVMLVVFTVVALLRPAMRQVRLPLYARMSLILAITACLQVTFLFVGMWQRSPLVWSLSFFPVIILAMMAEAIAGAMDNHSLGAAAWRLGWTLVVAFGLYLFMRSAAMTALTYAPELLLLQLGLIVLVSEYLDLRLLQDWQSQLAPLRAKYTPWWIAEVRRPRVALVRNRSQHGTIGRLGPQAPPELGRVSLQHLVDGLRESGYYVKVFEGDMNLLRSLRTFLPPHPRTGAPGGVVLNLSEGIQGESRHSHVPAMLEMAGIAYTGPNPACHAVLDDPLLLRLALEHAGVPTAAADAVGREVHAGVLGGTPLRALPLAALTGERLLCPADLTAAEAAEVRRRAFAAFRAAGCRDFAIVRMVLTEQGEALVTAVEVHGVLARRSSAAVMLGAAGLDWGTLAAEIVELAAARNGVEWASRPVRPAASDDVAPAVGAVS